MFPRGASPPPLTLSCFYLEVSGQKVDEHALLGGQVTFLRVRAISIISTVAGMLETTDTAERPILECELPGDGSRFEALIPPVVQAPVFSIRKKASAIFRLDEYVSNKIRTERQQDVILEAIAGQKNILIAGGTGTGKTTLANAVVHSIAEHDIDHRIVILEDTVIAACCLRGVGECYTFPMALFFVVDRSRMRAC